MTTADAGSALFEPLRLRGVTLPNRIGVSPMCMYSSRDGFATDFHLVHLGRFALGGAGLVIMEATAVSPRGRISPRDAGIWKDAHMPRLAQVARFLTDSGAVAGIQLAHAGRRAAVREPWRAGAPLDEQDAAAGFPPWQTEAPSTLAPGAGWPEPNAMNDTDIRRSIREWRDAARRAVAAGFRFIELHGAHGYLLHSFLSPLSNRRTDEWGGSAAARQRYPLAVVDAVREAIGPDNALSYRVSAVDGIDGGLGIEDTIEFARALAAHGVDIVDTSSGGISTDRTADTRVRRGFAFHADFSRAVRHGAGVAAATVGFVVDPRQAELLVDSGDADLVLLGREMLDDPNWAHHARRTVAPGHEAAHWDIRFGSALTPRQGTLARLAASGETPLTRFGH
ncbi:NADH:flavin oxidoreductase/NADH oxidase [Microbacterium sp. zg.Y1090]|uniref:NADH:flavin oxidoreductase/NADH oxidase n=1 Tax=Microbacterium TaxID=33882 RepID=UPI00214AE1EF|nr:MULTISPECIES: NADH:flavin oxidoreductase/NADH oxidase [unclassified Microbacterium]MCR2813302.1 NADH:flavin oxidoreductase/NADH oxidase [Microbacterium sp. zg.Y1084]MCR2819864.1 NADH:flavin oxidoreductase/NADH oxidase [Microbacterium sp. zg.Y1090]WIM28579.1 NADH:flavin oxidoreductase/NADH oxidase [Microbacterium sp. zg-Y1090]